jgi:hypothetical protein
MLFQPSLISLIFLICEFQRQKPSEKFVLDTIPKARNNVKLPRRLLLQYKNICRQKQYFFFGTCTGKCPPFFGQHSRFLFSRCVYVNSQASKNWRLRNIKQSACKMNYYNNLRSYIFRLTRQPSSRFTFQKYVKRKSYIYIIGYFWKANPDDGCLVQPKHILVYFRIIMYNVQIWLFYCYVLY